MQAVDVLPGIQSEQDRHPVESARQRELHQDRVDVGVVVEQPDAAQEPVLADRGLETHRVRSDPHLGAGGDLVAHVDLRGGIVPDQDGGQTRGPAGGRLQIGDLAGDLGPDRPGHGRPIEALRRHAGVTPSKAACGN